MTKQETIGTNILKMSLNELQEFVRKRRTIRGMKEYAVKRRKPAQRTVATVARDLGVDKSVILESLNEK